jgi:hypothetical protein
MKINIYPLGLLSGVGIITLAIFPAQAVNLSVSNLFLEIDNFNRPALGAIATGDNQVINIAETGISQTDLRGSAFFTSDSFGTRGQIAFENQTLGFGDSYFGKADINASLGGTFFVPANQALTFDFRILRELYNVRESLNSTAVSSATKINFSLFEESLSTEEFNLLSQINTNSSDFFRSDYSDLLISDNITISNYMENTIFNDQQESIATFLTGSFQWIAPRDTFIFLEVTAQSCTYNSNQLQTCITIPEPQLHPRIVFGFLSLFLLPRLIKEIIQFVSQPFRK